GLAGFQCSELMLRSGWWKRKRANYYFPFAGNAESFATASQHAHAGSSADHALDQRHACRHQMLAVVDDEEHALPGKAVAQRVDDRPAVLLSNTQRRRNGQRHALRV